MSKPGTDAAPRAQTEPDVLDSTRAGGLVMRGGVVRTAGYVVATALSLLSFALITRHLGVARFGDYQTALSVVTIVSSITDAGMATLAVREYTTAEGAARDRLMRNVLGARLLLTVAGIAGAIVFALAAGFDGALLAGTALAGIGVGLNVVQSMLAVPLVAQLQLTTQTALELLRQVVLVAVLVACVLAGAGVLPLLAAMIPAGAVAAAATAWVVRGRIPLRPSLHPADARRLLKLAVPVVLTVATGTLYIFLAQVLTHLVASERQSGLFAASFRVFIVVAAVPGLLVSSAFPLLARAARDDQERLAYAVDRLFATMAVLGGAVGLGLSVGAPVVIDIVAGPGYDGAIGVLQVQAWALTATFVLASVAFAMLSLHLHRQIAFANLLALATSAALTLTLARSHGALGASWATVAGETVLAVGSILVLAHARPDLRPRLGVLAKVALGAGAGAAAQALLGLPSIPATLVALAVYGAVVLGTRAVPDELRALVRRA